MAGVLRTPVVARIMDNEHFYLGKRKSRQRTERRASSSILAGVEYYCTVHKSSPPLALA